MNLIEKRIVINIVSSMNIKRKLKNKNKLLN